MKKLAASIVAVMSIATSAMPQDPTSELLTSPRIRSWLTFKLYGTGKDDPAYTVEFAPDTKEPLEFKSYADTYSVVTSAPLRLYLSGYAPFLMHVDSSIKEETDPSVDAIAKFLEAVTTLGGHLGVKSESLKDASESNLLNALATTKLMMLSSAPANVPLLTDMQQVLESHDLEGVTAPEVLEWFMWFSQDSHLYCFEPDVAQETFDALVELDTAAFEGTGIAAVLDEHKTAATKSRIAEAAKNLADASKDLAKKIKEARKKYDSLEDLEPEIASNKGTDQDCKAFAGYTRNAIAKLLDRAGSALDAKDSLRSSSDSLTKLLEGAAGRFRDEDHYYFGEVPERVGKLRTVTMTFQPRTIEVNEDATKVAITDGKKLEKTLRVRDYSNMAPQFSLGAAYANVAYPKFGTGEAERDGTTVMVVEEGDAENGGVEAAALLNLPFRTGGRVLHPMAQLGVSTAEERPSLLVGGGLFFTQPKHLAIGLGALFPWFRELGSLEPGDEVTGTAQIEDDLHVELQSPELYIAIQYSF